MPAEGNPDRGGVPVTILGGYLGSGKTTRINALLQQPHGLRLAVVVNDFGSVNIDAALLRSRARDLLELSNGCICCSLADGMAAVMHQLVELRPRPHLVLVEVSGVGDPAAVAQWGSLPGFVPGGVAVCADAQTVEARAADRWVGDTVHRQLAGADLVLLTKTDLVEELEEGRVRRWLDSVTPGVPVDGSPDGLARFVRAPVSARSSGTAKPVERKEDTHSSWTLATATTVDGDRLRACLGRLPEDVVRFKGVLRTTDRPERRTVVQGVGQRWELSDDGPWRPGERSVLVLIAAGPGLTEPPGGGLVELFEA